VSIFEGSAQFLLPESSLPLNLDEPDWKLKKEFGERSNVKQATL
jgi:hypothetical protein